MDSATPEKTFLDPGKFIALPIEKLVKAGWNYKVDDDDLKNKLKENLKRNGQLENIVVRELENGFYEIVNGNHRYDAMVELKIPAVMCYNLGVVTQQHAMRIAVELNETRFGSNNILLATVIKEISTEFSLEDMETSLPFSLEDISNMVQLTTFDFDQFDPEPPEPTDEDGKRLIIDITEELQVAWLAWKTKCGANNNIEALSRALDKLSQ